MTTTEKATFTPNCVFIPAAAVWKDRRGEHVDPQDATRLMLEGDNNYGEVFTSEAWESDGQPSYLRRFGNFVTADDIGSLWKRLCISVCREPRTPQYRSRTENAERMSNLSETHQALHGILRSNDHAVNET